MFSGGIKRDQWDEMGYCAKTTLCVISLTIQMKNVAPLYNIGRSSRLQIFFKTSILKNFTNFFEKHLC